MQTSEQINEISTALVAVQAQVSHVKATRTGNVGNHYATAVGRDRHGAPGADRARHRGRAVAGYAG